MTRLKLGRVVKSFYNWIGAIIIFFVGLLFVVSGIRDIMMVSQVGSLDYLTYEGSYMFYEKRYSRNISYRFVLDNGDVISIAPEYVNDAGVRWEDHSRLVFQYLPRESLFLLGTHTCISITTPEEERIFVQADTTKTEIRSMAICLMVVGILCINISGIPILFLVLEKNLFWRQRRKRSLK